jgi:LysR family glycine cleavage system transcriptional activator
LLHVDPEHDGPPLPGWPAWVAKYGLRREGADRGVHFRQLRLALAAVRRNVGFLVCGLGLARSDLDAGAVVLVYPAERHLSGAHPYRYFVRNETRITAQVRRFADWLSAQARESQEWIDRTAGVQSGN